MEMPSDPATYAQIPPTLQASFTEGAVSMEVPIEAATMGTMDEGQPTLLERGEMLLELFRLARDECEICRAPGASPCGPCVVSMVCP
jgi:hypothetical protein